MKIPKLVMGITRAKEGKDTTVFTIIKVKPNPITLSIDVKVKAVITLDASNLTMEEASKAFEKKKRKLMNKYNIDERNII